jgi:hypothetical protein
VDPVNPDPDSDKQHWGKGISVSTWTKRPSTSAAPPFTTSEMKTPGPLFLPTILQTNQSFTLHSFYLRTMRSVLDLVRLLPIRTRIQTIQKRHLLRPQKIAFMDIRIHKPAFMWNLRIHLNPELQEEDTNTVIISPLHIRLGI